MTPPVKALDKLMIEADLDQRNFNIKTVPALSKMQDIQRWYNVLHARGYLCGIYTTPWETFTKASYMGTMWSLAFLDQAVMDRADSMSAALHVLFSAHTMFLGDCTELTHMITDSGGNGYLALYQSARLAHPLLGQVTAQKEQPQHRKSQSFAEHISYYLDYFQSEACSSQHCPLNERVLLILGRLHPTWRNVMKKKYMQLVPHNGIIPPIPLECHLEMLGVTLTQWCAKGKMESPSPRTERSHMSSTPVFAIEDNSEDDQDTFTPLLFQESPSPDVILGHTCVPSDKIDNAIQHMVCYIDRGGSKSNYLKCEACGLAGHTAEKCNPLIFFCIAQALASQHPDVVRKIKAAYKQFTRNARTRTPRKATVKQIVAFLDLPAIEDIPISVYPSD
jgi:hypothetical protein